MPTVLIVEDDNAIRDMVKTALEAGGYSVIEAVSTIEARRALASGKPDIVLMDWMLPGQSGFELTRTLRMGPSRNDIPVIMLTARDQEQDMVAALEAGADDYISKPFSVKELLTRIKVILRRTSTSPETRGEILNISGLELNQASHRVRINGTPLRLARAEFQLLKFFMLHPERVYTRAQLIDSIWGCNAEIEVRTVDVHIRRLRKLLEPSGHDALIQTVRGTGYRFSSRIQ